MIPDEAVEVLARILANEELFRAECEGYGWDAEKDSSDPFMPSARKEAKRYLEAAAPHLMAAVSTVAELDALPRFSVIRSGEGAVFERQTMWHEAGSRDLMYSPDIALPATVLQLGWGEE